MIDDVHFSLFDYNGPWSGELREDKDFFDVTLACDEEQVQVVMRIGSGQWP